MKRYLIALGFLIPSVTYAQTEILPGVTQGKDYGVVYTLPKTQINIDVKVNKVIYTPGEFCRYADLYLRIKGVSPEASEYWELKSVTANSVGIPNTEQSYFIKMKDKTVAPLVELTEDGLIQSINAPMTAKGNRQPATRPAPQQPTVDPRDFFTEEILMANSSAKMAELISKEIYYIRESRNALVRGQADNMPTDGEQLKIMLNNLDIQERAMLELFTGTSRIEEQTITFKLIPSRDYKDEVVFRFSQKLGALDKNDLAGEPIYINLKNLHTVSIPEEVGKPKKLEGIAYNVPGKANITLTYNKNKLYEGDLLVTQFGIIEYLTPALFNKNSTVKVFFHPESGSLKKVERE